jgi:pyruvate/2-oxoglutarate dehydrogenase complex dihydrolipoamide dehydrogenase (E3) component
MQMAETYDLVIIGAGSGGLTAASFASRLGARVALVEKGRIGGDCTWTGCVPSKALIKAAAVAHAARAAAEYGIITPTPVADMPAVREYVRRAIAGVYRAETPEQLAEQGLDVVIGAARFIDAHTVQAGALTLTGSHFLIATGAHPVVPSIPGLRDVPFVTYQQIFENDRLPARLLVLGAGPIGVELAQAYRRLGAEVRLVGQELLPREELEAVEVMARVFAREGIETITDSPTQVRREGAETVVALNGRELRGDMLLVATDRAPAVDGLNLEAAGVRYSHGGIHVDKHLRTTAPHIYAAGDCVGSYQFTHFAAWQAFQAARNALLPGRSSGVSDVVPVTTFTDPEVARVGLTEKEARQKFGAAVRAASWPMERTDRAVADNARDGFVKVIHKRGGALLGATVVAPRAGEVITEFALALRHGMKVGDLASTLHAYPTYSTPVLQVAAGVVLGDFLAGATGKVLRRLAIGRRSR